MWAAGYYVEMVFFKKKKKVYIRLVFEKHDITVYNDNVKSLKL